MGQPDAAAAGEHEQIPIGHEPPKEEAAAAAGISGAPPPPEHKVLSKEEKVEYRDQDGNLLDPEQVKALEGKVEFKTKYETRTRVVDEDGNEVQMPEGGWPEDSSPGLGVAPPHPDVEGINSETVQADNAGQPQAEDQSAEASQDGEKEAEQIKPKPASDNQEATEKEEL